MTRNRIPELLRIYVAVALWVLREYMNEIYGSLRKQKVQLVRST